MRSKHSGGSWTDDLRKWAYEKVGGTGQRGKQIERELCKAGASKCDKKKGNKKEDK